MPNLFSVQGSQLFLVYFFCSEYPSRDYSFFLSPCITYCRWPFEELVCSNAGRLKLILDHAGGMLRATASNFINSDETFYTSSSVRFQYTLFKASSAPGLRQQRQRSLEALGKGEEQDGLKVQCEHFKLWLSKMKEDLVSRLAISPYAPKTEASRLAKTVSDNMQSKIKGKKYIYD